MKCDSLMRFRQSLLKTMKDIREYWIQLQRDLSAAAENAKESQQAAFGLLDSYDSLSPEERELIHPVIGEWLKSEENTLRYDAAFLVSQRSIHSLTPAIKEAIDHLRNRTDAEAKFEIDNLSRIFKQLK